MSRPVPTPPPTDLDPLADLRQGLDPLIPPSVQVNGDPDAADPDDGGESVRVRPMVSEEVHQDMVSEVVAAWHVDPTSQGFLHGGAQCGCRFIASLALRTAVPVLTEADLEERELEPSGE